MCRTDECVGLIPEGTNLLSELYSDSDAENGLLVERYFVSLEAMDQVLLKHKSVVDKVVNFWKGRLNALYLDLDRKYSDRLRHELHRLKENDKKVREILDEVRKESQKELEWINSLRTIDSFEHSFKADMEKFYDNEISRITEEFEDRLHKETEHLTQTFKKKELEAKWAAKVEAEQTYRSDIQSIEAKWEKKYVSDMASLLSKTTLCKVSANELL